MACSHLVDRASGEYNLPQVPRYLPGRAAVLVNLFHRELGLVVWTGNPRKLEGIGDLGRRGLRFVNRQPGSGTRAVIDDALAAAGVETGAVVGYREEVSTHWAVALRILRGEADVGVATRSVAAALSLGFIPLARERFDLVIPKDGFFRPPVQARLEASAPSGSAGASSVSADTTGRRPDASSARSRDRPSGAERAGGVTVWPAWPAAWARPSWPRPSPWDGDPVSARSRARASGSMRRAVCGRR